MYRPLCIFLVVFGMFLSPTLQATNKDHSATDKQEKPQDSDSGPKFDTSSLEKTIRESIKNASDKEPNHEEDHLKNEGQLVKLTGQLAIATDSLSRFTLWLVIATAGLFIVAIFQLCMFWRQLALMKDGAKDTKDVAIAAKDSANAAKAQADAIVNAERAIIFVEFHLAEKLRSCPSGFKNTIGVNIWNYGKTAAEITQIRCYATLPKSSQEPPPQSLAEHSTSNLKLPPGLGIAANCAYPSDITCILNDKELGEIDRIESFLYIVGCISYKDIFGENRETGFCWQLLWHMGNQRFIPTRDSALNHRT